MQRRFFSWMFALLLLCSFCGCSTPVCEPDEFCIAATTYPVWQFTCAVTEGTPIQVEQVISEPVSCVHDYTLSVDQMKAISRSRAVVISGLGLEDFMEDALASVPLCIDASAGVEPLASCEQDAEHDHDHEHEHEHDHAGHDHGAYDPHLWLDPVRAASMMQNISDALSTLYPAYAEQFSANAERFGARLDSVYEEGMELLKELSCRELVTFHDGFSYFADAFGLKIAAAMEVEAGSEPPARSLEQIVWLLRDDEIPAVFYEASGDDAIARLVAAETDAGVFALDLGMGERDYFEALTHNLNTIKEALQ